MLHQRQHAGWGLAWLLWCMQWLQKLRSSQAQDAAFDACVSATCAGVLDAVTCHGMRALQAPKVAAALACIAHRSNAATIMRSLLAGQHCKDAPGVPGMAWLAPSLPVH